MILAIMLGVILALILFDPIVLIGAMIVIGIWNIIHWFFSGIIWLAKEFWKGLIE